jgi:hypothetical protein
MNEKDKLDFMTRRDLKHRIKRLVNELPDSAFSVVSAVEKGVAAGQ